MLDQKYVLDLELIKTFYKMEKITNMVEQLLPIFRNVFDDDDLVINYVDFMSRKLNQTQS